MLKGMIKPWLKMVLILLPLQKRNFPSSPGATRFKSRGRECTGTSNSLQGALEDFDKTSPSTTQQTSQTDSQNGADSSDCTKKTGTKACEKSSDTTTVKTQGSTSATASSQDTSDHARLEANLGQVPGLDELENVMKTMLGNEPELLAQLGQFAQAAANADHGKGGDS